MTLTGYSRVINWPNVSTVVFQGIKGPKESEAEGEWSVGISVRTHTIITY